MLDYVVYHKAEKMGYPALNINNLAIYTKKSTDGKKGCRIWLIAGEGSPRKYYLRASFLISNVKPSNKPEFISMITGTDGQLFDPMPLLNDEKWMPNFVKEQGNFAFGFNQIKNDKAIKGLRQILLANTLR
ncbi:hypothetical protein [Polaromonas hydrogenivorans]|uniref:Uncharacterized protein n=1 Tax=Polaromonas hydrogenivorans TaxID=335476 RepID=A0AAU7LWE7_9BURK